MEMYISKKKVFEYASSCDRLSEIHSQMARKTHSEKTAKCSYHCPQVIYFSFTRFTFYFPLKDIVFILYFILIVFAANIFYSFSLYIFLYVKLDLEF